jgi:hypothetical protein
MDNTFLPKNVCSSCWYITDELICEHCNVTTPKGCEFFKKHGLTGEECCGHCGFETAKNGVKNFCMECGLATPWSNNTPNP